MFFVQRYKHILNPADDPSYYDKLDMQFTAFVCLKEEDLEKFITPLLTFEQKQECKQILATLSLYRNFETVQSSSDDDDDDRPDSVGYGYGNHHDYNNSDYQPGHQVTDGRPVPAPRTGNTSSGQHINPPSQIGPSTSTKSNYSGSSGSPASTSRAPSFDNNTKQGGSSFDTVSIGSGLSVPPSYDGRSFDGAQAIYGSSNSRSNSFRGSDRSPRPGRHGGRSSSPNPSVISSDKERDDLEQLDLEEEDRKRKLQIYVFVLRCIAFPFNAKQPQDMQKRQAKIGKGDLPKIKERFESFLKGETSIMADEAFKNAVQSYHEVFLNSDRVKDMVRSGGCSANDFREVFKNNIEKRVRSLPEIDGLSKETVLSSWMTKFDTIYRGEDNDTRRHQRSVSTANEVILSKDQLYEMFQVVLSVKKYEHLILYNALQLDNPDEQAAQVRRELASRQNQIESGLYRRSPHRPKFVVKEMDMMYIEELNAQILQLKANLESVPFSKVGSQPKNPKKSSKPHHSIGKIDVVEEHEQSLSKLDVVLSFTVEIIVKEVRGLKIPPTKNIFCIMEVEGGDKLQTGITTAAKPTWVTQGDFTTTQPLPVVKIKLCMQNSGMLSLDDKEMGRVILKPTAMSSKAPNWYKMVTPKNIADPIDVYVAVRIEKPQNMKYCGSLFALGKKVWKTCKKRYFVLVQVSQYNFAVCSYKEKKSEPIEMLQLKGYTVDYCEPNSEMASESVALYCFNAVKEGDSVTFASSDETERHNWVQALYRATGQSHKPTPPAAVTSNGHKNSNQFNQPKAQGEFDRAKKHGLDEYVSANPCMFDHADCFKYLQHLSLEYRMNDAFTCLGWFSPAQIFILDEYAARYGVRGCHRHLSYLSDLLDKAENGLMIDPTLMHYSFAFCASHVFGNKPDGLATIIVDERQKFEVIRESLRDLLEHQITHFRYCFPFGRPEGALKATLSLLERVLMKDVGSPISAEEVRSVIRKCLANAALVNYTRISEFAKIEEAGSQDCPNERLDDIIHLAGLCIEVLQQNEEHHAEAFTWFNDLLVEHNEMFWSLFAVDMDGCLEAQPTDCWDSFPLFSLLNAYLLTEKSLRHGKFHNHLRDTFAPQVVRYVDLMESSIAQSIHKGFSKERWEPQGSGCETSEEMLWKLDALQTFIKDLQWPEEVFAEHLEHRLKLMASDMIEAAGNRTMQSFDAMIQRVGRGTDLVIPSELCVMINTVSDCKSQAVKLCIIVGDNMHQYHTRIEEFLERALKRMMDSLITKLLNVLENVLSKLKRYDEGSFFKGLLSLTKPTDEQGKDYVSFLRTNLDMIRQKTVDEMFVIDLFQAWYNRQMCLISEWLAERLEMPLHNYQLSCLIHIARKCYSDIELQGVPEDSLKTKAYQTVVNRLTVEEATQACMEGRNARLVTGLSMDDEKD